MSFENIAPTLSEDDAKKIAAQAVKDFESDDDSRKDWLEMHAGWLRMFYQQDKRANPPWAGASEETIPLLTEACTQFHARALTSLFPGRTIVTAIPTLDNKPETDQRAKRVGKHMSWQLMVQDENYKADKDTLLFGLPLHGSYFTKTYFDPQSKRNKIENVRPEDLVIPYGIGPRPMESVERKTQIIWQTMNEAKALVATEFYSAMPEEWKLGNTTPTQTASDKAVGQSAPFELGLACICEQHCIWDLNGDGIGEPYIIWFDRQSKKLLRMTTREEEFFTHYCYLPNPEGFYGLGDGALIGPINRAVNKLLQQTIDAGMLATVGNMGGLVSSQLSVRGGEIELVPGQFRKTDFMGDDIRKAIYQNQFPGPAPTLSQAIALLMSRSDRLANVTEMTTGQPDKVYQPTMAMAMIEQAQQVYTAVYQRVLGAWERELRKIYALNGKYMPDVQQFAIPGASGIDVDVVKKDDYAPDLMVMPIADPKQTSVEKKITKAQMEFQFFAQNPLVQQNPVAFYFVSRRWAEAMEVQNIDQMLPPPFPREDDPYKENASALMPNPVVPPSFPDQDHMSHIVAHRELLGDPTVELSPEGVKAIEEHIQMHTAQLYEVAHGAGPLHQNVPGAMGPPGGVAPMLNGGGINGAEAPAANGGMGQGQAAGA